MEQLRFSQHWFSVGKFSLFGDSTLTCRLLRSVLSGRRREGIN